SLETGKHVEAHGTGRQAPASASTVTYGVERLPLGTLRTRSGGPRVPLLLGRAGPQVQRFQGPHVGPLAALVALEAQLQKGFGLRVAVRFLDDPTPLRQ